MAYSDPCPICGKNLGEVGYSFNGEILYVCSFCSEEIVKLSSFSESKKEHAKEYFQRMLDNNRTIGIGTSLAQSLLINGPSVTEYKVNTNNSAEESPNIQSPSSTPEVIYESHPQISNTSLKISGAFFLALAIILYIVSIRSVGTFQVANIQSTVFAAASAVISAVSFVGAKIVSALNGKS